MTLRKIAAALAALGLVLGLVGAGVSATFQDTASAEMTIHVGTFDIEISSTQGSVVGDTVTFHAPTIQSSAPGSAPFVFTVTSTGSIPALIHVAVTDPGTPFTDLLGPLADFTLNQGQSHVFHAGLAWPELGMSDLGDGHAITYTITATQ